MQIGSALAVYFIIWWLVLFTTLPFGVRSQAESEDVVAGTEPGAPVAPQLLKKALWTTVIATVIFIAVWFGLGALDA
jgi:predicted secreted protein